MAKKKVTKKKPPKTKEPPIYELYIMGVVESWHVNMVAHHKVVEVPRNQAKYEVTKRDGSVVFTRHAVSDHLELELEMVLREPIRGFDRLTFLISEWDAEEYGGISGELRYDKESGMRGGVHMSGSFPRDLYALLLSGTKAAFEISTRSGFYRRNAWVTALAFSDAGHPQWVDGESGLI